MTSINNNTADGGITNEELLAAALRIAEGGPVIHKAGTLGEELREWALWYTQVLRWWVFPLVAFGKKPATRHGFKDATIFEKQIREWWNGDRLYNIGVVTGYPGPDVLDVEGIRKPGGSGWAGYYRLKDAGMLTGAHLLAGTPSEGAHIYFKGTEQKSGHLKAWHIDFQARGGYITAPPSRINRPYHGSYKIIDSRPPTGATFDWDTAKNLLSPPKPVPARRVSRRKSGSVRRGPGSPQHLVRWLEGEFEGNRNNGLFWAATRAFEAGAEDTVDELAEVALAAGLGADEVAKTVQSARKAADDGR